MPDEPFDEIRRRRVLENERLFRSANQAKEAEAIRYHTPETSMLDFVCECAEVSCVQRIRLTLDEYLHTHASEASFTIAPGHELLQYERVVERNDRYEVVEKLML